MATVYHTKGPGHQILVQLFVNVVLTYICGFLFDIDYHDIDFHVLVWQMLVLAGWR